MWAEQTNGRHRPLRQSLCSESDWLSLVEGVGVISTVAVIVMMVAIIFLCVQIYEQSFYVRWPIFRGDVIGFGVGPSTVDWDDAGRVDHKGKSFFVVRVQVNEITREYRFYQFVEGLRVGDKVGVHVHPAESSTKCNTDLLNGGIGLIELVQHGLVDADGRVEAVDGARAGVEQVGDRIELLLAADREVRALGQELADQPVGVLAGAALP